MKRIIGIIVLFFVCISGAAAVDLLAGLEAYYNYNSDTTDATGNGNNQVASNAITFVAGKINNSIEGDGTTSYVTYASILPQNDTFTTTGWFYLDELPGAGTIDTIWGNEKAGVGIGKVYVDQGGNIVMVSQSSTYQVSIAGISATTWYFFEAGYNHSTGRLFLRVNDGAKSNGTNPIPAGWQYVGDGNVDVAASNRGDTNHEQWFNGRIDELAFYNRTLEPAEVTNLYNSGLGLTYPFTPPPEITIDNVSVNNVTLANNTYFSQTMNFTVNTTNVSTNNNINLSYSLDNTSHVQFSTDDPNGEFQLYAGKLFIQPKRLTRIVKSNFASTTQLCIEETGHPDIANYTTFPIQGATSEWNGTAWKESLLPGTQLLNITCGNLTQGMHNIYTRAENNQTLIDSSVYTFFIDLADPILQVVNFSTIYNYTINFSTLINVSDSNLVSCIVTTDEALQVNCTDTYTFITNGNHTFNVTATDNASNTADSNNNIIFVNPYQSFFFFDQNNGTFIQNYTFGPYSSVSTEVSFLLYDLGLGNHTLELNKPGYAAANFTFEFNLTSNFNKTYNVTASEIKIFFLDRNNGSKITEFINVELVGPTGFTGNTTDGNITIQQFQLDSGSYKVIASSENYSTEQYFFTYNNEQLITINLYMLKETDPNFGAITINVKNEFEEELNNITVKLLEWQSDVSAFVDVSQTKTNLNGQAFFNIEIGTKNYIFFATNGVQIAQSSEEGEVVFNDAESRTLILRITAGVKLSQLDGILYNVSENQSIRAQNKSQIFFSWSDPANTVSQGCIKYYKDLGVTKELLSQTCVNASTGIMSPVVLLNTSINTLAEASLITDDGEFVIGRFSYKGTQTFENVLQEFGLITWIMLLLFVGAFGVGFLIGNVMISAIASVVVSWICVFMFPTYLSTGIAVTITIMSIFMIQAGFKKE